MVTLALLRQDAVKYELGGDPGVVQPGQEEGRVAAHACMADHPVFHRGPLRVPEVE